MSRVHGIQSQKVQKTVSEIEFLGRHSHSLPQIQDVINLSKQQTRTYDEKKILSSRTTNSLNYSRNKKPGQIVIQLSNYTSHKIRPLCIKEDYQKTTQSPINEENNFQIYQNVISRAKIHSGAYKSDNGQCQQYNQEQYKKPQQNQLFYSQKNKIQINHHLQQSQNISISSFNKFQHSEIRNVGDKYKFQQKNMIRKIRDSSGFIHPSAMDQYPQNEPDRNIDTYFGQGNYYESLKGQKKRAQLNKLQKSSINHESQRGCGVSSAEGIYYDQNETDGVVSKRQSKRPQFCQSRGQISEQLSNYDQFSNRVVDSKNDLQTNFERNYNSKNKSKTSSINYPLSRIGQLLTPKRADTVIKAKKPKQTQSNQQNPKINNSDLLNHSQKTKNKKYNELIKGRKPSKKGYSKQKDSSRNSKKDNNLTQTSLSNKSNHREFNTTIQKKSNHFRSPSQNIIIFNQNSKFSTNKRPSHNLVQPRMEEYFSKRNSLSNRQQQIQRLQREAIFQEQKVKNDNNETLSSQRKNTVPVSEFKYEADQGIVQVQNGTRIKQVCDNSESQLSIEDEEDNYDA